MVSIPHLAVGWSPRIKHTGQRIHKITVELCSFLHSQVALRPAGPRHHALTSRSPARRSRPGSLGWSSVGRRHSRRWSYARSHVQRPRVRVRGWPGFCWSSRLWSGCRCSLSTSSSGSRPRWRTEAAGLRKNREFYIARESSRCVFFVLLLFLGLAKWSRRSVSPLAIQPVNQSVN